MSLTLLICVTLFAGFKAEALSYDYSASIECLENPQMPQYNGGIIQNPGLNDGLKGWTAFGDAKIEHRESSGNKYVVAHSRNQAHDSVSQKIYLQKEKHYTLSAWIQVSEGNGLVTAVVLTTEGFKFAGATFAESNCWSMLKGGLTAETSGIAELYFECAVSNKWKSHQDQSIEKARKRKVLVQAVDEQGNPLPNASISITQKKSHFPFGSAMSNYILTNRAYQNWFTSRFTVTAFENEMKWSTTEYAQGQENYHAADAMMQFAKQNNIAVRGHNIFWEIPNVQSSWVASLSPNQLGSAVMKRVNSLVSRYKGQVIVWDVVNENMHSSFFEDKLGQDFSAKAFKWAHDIDGKTTLFLNEYNTIEDGRDAKSNPASYIKKIRQILSYPGNSGLPLGIGLQSHFTTFPPNLPYMRASIDTLASTGFPIWITELDVAKNPRQAEYFEQVLREAHSHPKIQGIVMWPGWSPTGNCFRMCLVDNNFNNLPTGNVVDKLLHEWGLRNLSGKTDQNGFLEVSLFHGDYEIEISHPAKKDSTSTQHVQVIPKDESKKATQFVQLSM